MDGSHPSSDPIPHRHLVTLDWFRTEVQMARTLGALWDLELDIPYDVKDQTVRYELPDGTPYDSPTGPIHHRDERLEGIGDIRLVFNWRPEGLLMPGDRGHFGFGLSLPAGRTERNPYELAALGREHRHIQFGTGTVDPILRFDYTSGHGAFAFDVALGIQAPLYENPKGYHGSTVVDLTLGPRLSVTEWLSVAVHYTPVYQTRATWDDEPDENSGYFLQGITFTAPIRVGSSTTIVPMVLRTLSVDARSGADNFEMDWMVGISIQATFGGSARGSPPRGP